MDLLIRGARVLHLETLCRTAVEDVYIKDGAIAAVGEVPGAAPARVIEAGGKLLMPGLINCHTHAYMSLFRNYADDLSFEDWLFGKVMPIEDRMTGEDAYWCTQLSLLEMLKSGTTCLNDMHMFEARCADAVAEAGLRAVLGRGLSCQGGGDPGGQRRVDEALREMDCEAAHCGRISFRLAPHAVYTCDEGFLREVAQLAVEKGFGIHVHVSETKGEVERCKEAHGGMSPVQYLASLGIFDVPTVAAHCVWVDDADAALLAQKGVSVATNPVSNMKLASGFMPLTRLLKAGVNICMGTDSAASNNTQNMFKELSAFSYIHKGLTLDAQAAPADLALRCATQNGARALGIEAGAIQPGLRADLVLLDTHRPHLMPANDPVTMLAYAANGSEVDTVLVDGRVLLEKGEAKTIDEERVYAEVERIRQTYLI